MPRIPARSSPRANAQPIERSFATNQITTTAATIAITEMTAVCDVPVLKAAPGLRANSSSSRSPTRWTGP